MLPDFRSLKKRLASSAATTVHDTIERDGLLGHIASQRIHEGNRLTLVRADGSTETREFIQHWVRAEIEVDAIRRGDVAAVGAAVEDVAENVREQASKELFERVEEAATSAGNWVSGGGKPFTAEMWLATIEGMDLSFNDDGTWERPTVVIHPSMGERVRLEMKRMESEPELRARLEQLVERKREDWRDRESRRKLVD